MNFYKYIFDIGLIFTFIHTYGSDKNIDLIYPESGLRTTSPNSIGLVFFVKINNTSDKTDYTVEITPDECCLSGGQELDCETLQILGGSTNLISKGITKTLIAVAPLLNQYGRSGHCTLFVDSKSNHGQNKRDVIKIIFNAPVEKNYLNDLDNFKTCENKDEDPFNNCEPVNCDMYYNGKKPYFSRKRKRCVEVPLCIKDDVYNYPSVIYNPISNQCLEETLLKEDVEYLKNLNKDREKKRRTKDVLIINKFRPNDTDLANQNTLIDIIATTRKQELTKCIKVASLNSKLMTKKQKQVNIFKIFLKKYFIDNKWTLMILVLVVTIQCFLICTMIYCLSKTCNCCEDKQIIRKFFNYRQDVSVTTPLIGTSNIDTETTEYQYLTESSKNIDQKIKCYKACQKEKNNNIKISMSDDILSKCLNRRDWKKFQSEAITVPNNKTETIKNTLDNVNTTFPKNDDKRTTNETKVMFEDEKFNSIDKKKPKLVNIVSDTEILYETKDNQDVTENISSEKEIKCHSYNRFDAGVSGFRASLIKTASVFKNAQLKKDKMSNSTDKGAQAYFSNDSIDDFLSERDVIYLAGENMSKYTFSSGSNDMKPSTSSVSSKTSKNFVKNVLSLLHKKSKQGPSSDPGQNKEIDVELIHMSRASIYSSTNDSDCIKSLKRKDPRTSF